MRSSNALILLLALFVSGENADAHRLHYVATASQQGPVGYRDPIGVISPDGRWLAYTEGRFLKLQPVDGGPVQEFPPLHQDIRYLAWLPDSQSIAVPDRSHGTEPTRWYVFNINTGKKGPLWPENSVISSVTVPGSTERPVTLSELHELVWSRHGGNVAGIARTASGTELWSMNAEGGDARVQVVPERLGAPAFHPDRYRVACLSNSGGAQHLQLICGDASSAWPGDPAIYGPVVFSPDGRSVYYAAANERGTLDLWSRAANGDHATRLTRFSRDTYAPSIDEYGRVLFKVQDYRPVIAMASASGGRTRALTTFMAETPSWDWTGDQLGFTYGNWRRVVDDFNYPDIAQHVGIIRMDGPLPADIPHSIVSASTSEDQGQGWSPNGKWIAFHSHYNLSDDIWLVPADRSTVPRQITTGGHETGWPRWSADGKWLVYTGQKRADAPSRIYVLGVDQETGEVTHRDTQVALQDFTGEVGHAEWTNTSDALFFEAIHEPGHKAIYRIDRAGGQPQLVHAYESEEKYSGIGASPDGTRVAYTAPGPRGYQQIFRVRTDGGNPRQVTTDPTNKTHPAYSPDGEYIAFTVWRYEAQFWLLVPDGSD